jgi:uncharacterized protein (TIGR03437 family)
MMYVQRVLLFSFTFALSWAQQPFAPSVLGASGGGSKVLWGSYNGNLIRSKDLGVTWLPIYITEPGLPQPPVLEFDIDSGDPNTVYVGTTLVMGGVWKSTDGGATWVKANSGLPTSGGSIEYFKEIPASQTGNGQFFYAKTGNTLYKSVDRAATWRALGTIPGTSPNFDINDLTWSRMYWVDESTLRVWTSFDEGHSWQTFGAIPAPAPSKVVGTGSLFTNGSVFYSSIDNQSSYISPDSGKSNSDISASGLGLFARFRSFATGPIYAFGAEGGSYRSFDNGTSWKNIGVIGLERYALTGIDSSDHTIIYAVKTSTGKTLVRSTDAGDSWTPIASTITPTLAKPAAAYNIVLQEGAPYSVSFIVQAAEDVSWTLPATLSTTGEAWLTVGSQTGTTPITTSFTINSTGLAPGLYTSTLKIDSAPSANKSVSIPINLTIVPLGSIGPGYQISTVVGNGNATDTRTSGPATGVGIGATRAMTFDNQANLVISAGNRVWSLSGGNLNVLAGNGVSDSLGDGLPPTQASVADPESIQVDSAGNIFFTEYAPAGDQSRSRVRRVSGANISTLFQFSLFNVVTGSHSLVLDPSNNSLVTGPTGLLRFNGSKLLTVVEYPFTDPYGMVVGADGNYYISDRGSNQIFKMTPGGQVTVFAGTGATGFSGDGGSALAALFNRPSGIVFDAAGTTLYVADTGNQRVRQISPDGTIRTIAGSGVSGFAGDGQTGDFASFQNPVALVIDNAGSIYVADSGNNRIRKLTLRAVPTPKPSAITRHQSKSSQLSPGSIFNLYGDSLSNATATNANVPWARSLSGVSILINGVLAPLYYISPTQINGQIPYETQAGTATATITVNGSSPAQIGFSVVPASPSILVYGNNQAVAVNQNGQVNAPDVPATVGDYEVLYLSGIGQSVPAVPTGAGAPSVSPFALINYPYSITLNGQPCTVVFMGLAPGYPALAQANFQVPNLPPGNYPLVVTVNGQASDPVTFSVKSK